MNNLLTLILILCCSCFLNAQDPGIGSADLDSTVQLVYNDLKDSIPKDWQFIRQGNELLISKEDTVIVTESVDEHTTYLDTLKIIIRFYSKWDSTKFRTAKRSNREIRSKLKRGTKRYKLIHFRVNKVAWTRYTYRQSKLLRQLIKLPDFELYNYSVIVIDETRNVSTTDTTGNEIDHIRSGISNYFKSIHQ